MTDQLDLKAFESVPVAHEKPVVVPRWVSKLKVILDKPLNCLSDNDKEIIKARVSYLTEAQQITYRELLEVEDELEEDEEIKPTKVEETYKELQARAKAKGLKYVGVSKDKLIKLLNN